MLKQIKCLIWTASLLSLIVGSIVSLSCGSNTPATEKPIADNLSSYMKWETDSDGFGDKGLFRRKNSPSFTISYPSWFKKSELLPIQIFQAGAPNGGFAIAIRRYNGDTKESLHKVGKIHKLWLNQIGHRSKIHLNSPLPLDTYGKDHPAQEIEIDWMNAETKLSNYMHAIIKGDYIIILIYITGSDVTKIMAQTQAKALFKNINLNP